MSPNEKTSSDDRSGGVPLVSIYIPTRNRAAQLSDALSSARAQSYRNVEILVVDDGSTDSTQRYLGEIAAQDTRVKVLRNDQSAGAPRARNQAILASTGQFVTGLDDDDSFSPVHIEALVAYWSLLKTAGYTPAGLYVQYMYKTEKELFASNKPGSVSAERLLDANHLGNQVFAPREHFISAGLFDTEMPAWQDTEFMYRLLKTHGEARLLDIPTYVFDISPRDDRISSANKDKILNACFLMHKKHGNGNRRTLQRLMLQVYSSYYGFPITFRDLWRFLRLGWWNQGYAVLFYKFLRGSGAYGPNFL